MKVEVRIDEVVLQGIGAGAQHEIQAAMEHELARLLHSEAGAVSLGRRPDLSRLSRLDGGSLKLAATTSGSAIGTELARSIYRGLIG